MSVTTFLANETLWQTLRTRIKSARSVDAAIAYFGKGGASILPLRKGHRLIVDMSVPTVKAGGTDPSEIEKLIKRGVRVFTRENLHAKVVVIDKTVVSGSANVSSRSQKILDEAALATNDRVAVRRAREFIERLCTEPVRPEYLKTCKSLYRPPRANGLQGKANGQVKRAAHAKLWIANLREYEVPPAEKKIYGQIEKKAEEHLHEPGRSTTDSFTWPSKPRMADELETGDWIISVMTHSDGRVLVYPPGQLLFVEHYVRPGSEKERWVFCMEVPRQGEEMQWSQFCRKAASLFKTSKTKPRTRPIRDTEDADSLLRLWTDTGRISKR
jgi:hypothetical protein